MVKLFMSYARVDEKYKEELELRLKVFQRNGDIKSWNDREILAGMKWDEQIKIQIENADVFLFLISPNFIASDYIHSVEIKRALERYEKNEAIVIPIILRPTDFENTELSKFQAIPKDGKAITTWDDTDLAWHDVSVQLRKLFVSIKDGSKKLNHSVVDEKLEPINSGSLKSEIQNLVGQSKIEKALHALLDFAKTTKDDDLFNSAILLSSRFNNLKRSEMQGIISPSDAGINRAQITHSLLSLLDEY